MGNAVEVGVGSGVLVAVGVVVGVSVGDGVIVGFGGGGGYVRGDGAQPIASQMMAASRPANTATSMSLAIGKEVYGLAGNYPLTVQVLLLWLGSTRWSRRE